MDNPSTAPSETLDVTRRFVRVTERRANGFVAFDFSIGSPELVVELMLPAAAFDAFCESNAAVRLDVEDATTSLTMTTPGDQP